MAKVDYIRPVEAVHGKLAKEDEVGFARRNYINADEEKVKYTFNCRKRKHEATNNQKAWNQAFGNICKLARLRRMDESKISTDFNGFKSQSKYKTYRQYIWHVCEAQYNELAAG